jgi:hypothetical protein
VDEFWVCQHCRSLNRAGSGKCYSCHNKYGSRPAAAAAVNPHAGALTTSPPAPAAPARPAPPVPDFGAASRAPANPFTRPAALPPVAARPAGPTTRRSLNPVAAIRRRIASSLSMRQSVSVAVLGYVTAALIAAALLVAAVLAMALRPTVFHLLQHADPGAAWAELAAGQQAALQTLAIALAVVGTLALLLFSAFVGLTTRNAPHLGTEPLLLLPSRAATCWVSGLWTLARIGVGMIVPAALVWRGYAIPGLIAGIIAVEIAHRHLDDAGGWFDRPARHLPDLYAKLSLEGTPSSTIASLWSICFRLANLTAVALFAIPALAVALSQAATVAGRSDIVTWQSSGLGAAQLTVALLVISLFGWMAITTALLVPMTVGLVQRQRTRRTLVRVGRARSWVARPGEGEYGGAQAQTAAGSVATARYEGFDDDRIVERRPGIGQIPTEYDSAASGSGSGGSGWGAPRPSSPSFGGSVYGGSPESGSGLIGSGQSGPSFGGSSGFGGRRPSGSGFGDSDRGGSGEGLPF